MRLLDRLMAALPGGAGPRRDIDEPRNWGIDTGQSEAGEIVTASTAINLDIVQACLEVLAGSVSSLPLMVFERLDGDRRRPARDLPIFDVLHRRPNDRQTSQEFRDEQQRHLAYHRNCYARILSADGAPVAQLIPYHPDRLKKIERGNDGRVYYTFGGLGATPDEVVRDDLIWHIRKAPLTVDGLRGRGVYETSRETLGRALAVENYGARWFRNSGQSGGILKHPGTFKSKEDRDLFVETWRAGSTGAAQHRDRLLTHGVDYVPMSVQNDQAQFIETLKHLETKVCGLWNMPPHRVSRLDRATNNNIEHQGIEYVVHTLAPWICAWEQSASRDLLVGDEQDKCFVEFNVAGLLRGDISARYRAYAIARQWGWLSVNDIRRLENQDPVDGGDTYLQPLNMAPAGTDPSKDGPNDPGSPDQPAQPPGR